MKKSTTLACLLFASCVLLKAQQPIEPVVQFGHPGILISEAVLSPDGQVLATTDGSYLKLWDLASGLEFRSFKAAGSTLFGGIRNISFSQDGEWISYLTMSEKLTRKVATGTIGKKQTLLPEQTASPTTATDETEVDEEEARQMANAENYLAQAFSTDRKLSAVLTNKRLQIMEMPDEKVIQTIQVDQSQQSWFRSPILLLSPDRQSVLLDSTLYEISSGQPIFTFSPFSRQLFLTSATFAPDGKTVVFCGGAPASETMEQELLVWDMAAIIKRLNGIEDRVGEHIFVLDATSGEIRQTLQAPSITKCLFAANLSRFITGHLNGEVKIWDLAAKNATKTIQTAPKDSSMTVTLGVQAICPTKDGNSFIIGSTGSASKLAIWDISTGELIRPLGASIPPISLEVIQSGKDSIFLQEYEETLGSLPFLSDKKLKGVRILSLINGKVPHAFPRHDSIIFSPQYDYYLTYSKGGAPMRVFRAEDNDEIAQLEGSGGGFEKVLFSPDGAWVAGQTPETVLVWEATTGKLRHRFHEQGATGFSQIAFSPSSTALGLAYQDKAIRFWSMDDGRLIQEKTPTLADKVANNVRSASKAIANTRRKPEEEGNKTGLLGELLPGVGRASGAVAGVQNTADKIDKVGGLVFNYYHAIDISPDGKVAAVWRDDYASVRFIDLEKGSDMRLIVDYRLKLLQQVFMRYIGSPTEEERERLEGDTISVNNSNDLFMAAMLKQFKEKFSLQNRAAISPDWTRMAKLPQNSFSKKMSNITVYQMGKRQKRNDYELADSQEFTEGLTYSPDGTMIAASNSSNNSIRIWDAETGAVIKTLNGHSGQIAFSASGKTLISTGWDRQIKMWDLDTDRELYSFIGIQGENEYIILLSDGHYASSRKDTRAIAFAKGKEAYPFDQFDLTFNRPDLVLEQFKPSIRQADALESNKNLTVAYQLAYQKRLERMGIAEADLSREIHLPIVSISPLPLSSSKRELTLNVQASDSRFALSSLYVLVNGVPALPEGRLSLQRNKSRTFNQAVKIQLSKGENRIQLYVVNEKGAASLKYNALVQYMGPAAAKPDLHLVLVGGSDFADAALSLDYATKDLQDIQNLFATQKAKYNQIYTHRLIGKDFTLENFRKIKPKLVGAKVDDQVLVVIATHGLLGENFSYYLATYDTERDAPQQRGLPYEELEELLAAIPARQKTVLLDACHAGEIDQASIEGFKARQTISGPVKMRSLPSNGWEKLGDSQSTFDMMKDLFIDLRVGTGATVIGSASGLEFAYESESWNNSVFTYSLLRGLSKGIADLNSDGKIMVSELQQYLGRSVARLTNNLQQPIHRQENVLNDWQIW